MRALSQPEGKEASGPDGSRHGRFFEGFGDMLFITAARGRLIDVNQAGVQIFRYADRNDMCGIDSMASLFRDAEGWHLFWERIEARGIVKGVVMEMQRGDGSCFPACISANLCTGPGETIFCVGLLRDLTGHKGLQRALKESELPVREIGEHIPHTFMNLSHDIRGPLVSLTAGLELLARGRFGSMDESVVKKLKGLLRQAVRLNGIAEDCLARAAAIDGFGEIRREALDLRKDIIDPVLEELADEILSGRIRVENGMGAVPAGAVTIHAAGRWLRSVYRNLLKNAVQYGGKGCAISFGCEDHGRCHRLNVHNSGAPVPEELRDRLFTKFCRIGNAADGTGLGLYLVREIIRKHGGDIWYEAGRTGSNFVFTIPRAKQR
ncbi:MAG: PAS domain-containing sensor histidine kinase [Syntrophobacteraceae bacterium]